MSVPIYNSVQENPTLQGGDELNSENVQTELSFAFDKILSFAYMSSSLGKPLRRGGCHNN